jgi:signal transduction histidine kinase
MDNARQPTVTVAPQSFAQLVSLACHDLRTPLATASGFARTLQRLDELEPPADRYVEMIGAATDQLADLLDLLGAVTRIESDRFEPQLHGTTTRELADDAARRIESGRAAVEGDGAAVNADREWAAVCLSAVAEAARRHGGLEQITMRVEGPLVAVTPIVDNAGAIAMGDELRDFAAAVGVQVLQRSGAAVRLDGTSLHVRFPET